MLKAGDADWGVARVGRGRDDASDREGEYTSDQQFQFRGRLHPAYGLVTGRSEGSGIDRSVSRPLSPSRFIQASRSPRSFARRWA